METILYFRVYTIKYNSDREKPMFSERKKIVKNPVRMNVYFFLFLN